MPCAKSGITPPSRTCTLINTQTLTDVTDLMTKKYFPNNWSRIAKAPAEFFEPIPYIDFMEWKMDGWEIPASHECMIRAVSCKTGKVKEYVYQRPAAAKKKLKSLFEEMEHELIICTHDSIQHMKPEQYLTDNDKKFLYPK